MDDEIAFIINQHFVEFEVFMNQRVHLLPAMAQRLGVR
jgi:hypothetical protein